MFVLIVEPLFAQQGGFIAGMFMIAREASFQAPKSVYKMNSRAPGRKSYCDIAGQIFDQ